MHSTHQTPPTSVLQRALPGERPTFAHHSLSLFFFHAACFLLLLFTQHPLALELTADLPGEKALKRWLGEPVKAVILPTSIFLTNKLGYPTLSKKHQAFLCRLFRVLPPPPPRYRTSNEFGWPAWDNRDISLSSIVCNSS